MWCALSVTGWLWWTVAGAGSLAHVWFWCSGYNIVRPGLRNAGNPRCLHPGVEVRALDWKCCVFILKWILNLSLFYIGTIYTALINQIRDVNMNINSNRNIMFPCLSFTKYQVKSCTLKFNGKCGWQFQQFHGVQKTFILWTCFILHFGVILKIRQISCFYVKVS